MFKRSSIASLVKHALIGSFNSGMSHQFCSDRPSLHTQAIYQSRNHISTHKFCFIVANWMPLIPRVKNSVKWVVTVLQRKLRYKFLSSALGRRAVTLTQLAWQKSWLELRVSHLKLKQFGNILKRVKPPFRAQMVMAFTPHPCCCVQHIYYLQLANSCELFLVCIFRKYP